MHAPLGSVRHPPHRLLLTMSRGPSAHELWAECVRTMRDIGDAATIPTLRTLLVKDKFDKTRIAATHADDHGMTLLHRAALTGCVGCGEMLVSAVLWV